MDLVTVAMWTIHSAFAALWTGSVLFVTAAVLPAGIRGDLAAEALDAIVGRLRWVTRISALLLLVSGGHMAGTGYTADSLFGTGRGHLVLTMVALWFLLAGVVEVGSSKLSSGLAEGKLREPSREAKPFFYGASVLSVLLLVVAGMLGAGVTF